MASQFLTGQMPDGSVRWACIDEMSLCSLPVIGERRFAAYMAPFHDEESARHALLMAGANPIETVASMRSKHHGTPPVRG